MYIHSINYFRAISILFIVFGHSIGLADFTYDSIAGYTLLNLTKGGTAFFVFISGFMFHHVFYRNFVFNSFIAKKANHVLVPYLLLSTIPIAYLLARIGISGALSLDSVTTHVDALISFPYLKHYLTGVGRSFTGYWYIPFIMIVFAMSPIFVRFIQLSLRSQILITLILLVCSLFMHRGTYLNAYSMFQNVIFFTPVYLFGILASEKKELLYSKLAGKEVYIFALALTLAILQAYSGHEGNYEKDPFTYGGLDLILLQKILLCLFFMIFLHRFEARPSNSLNIIAANSFGVYFTHGIFIMYLENVKGFFEFSFASNSFLTYVLVALLVFALSISATVFVKRQVPKLSRYLVGS